MGRRCILDPYPPGRGMPAVVWRPACHSRRFKGERPIGAATGNQSQPPRPCAPPPSPTRSTPELPIIPLCIPRACSAQLTAWQDTQEINRHRSGQRCSVGTGSRRGTRGRGHSAVV